MIKTLKLSDKTVSKFKTHKKWKYSTYGIENSIILEQGDNIPLFADSSSKLCTEQNDTGFDVNIKKGKNIKGTFFEKDSKYFDETKEPLNKDGSYQRVVYNTVKHLFYNEYGLSSDTTRNKFYKNPMYMFGSETGIYTSDEFTSDLTKEPTESLGERRVVGDSITVLEIPSKVFGEKIKPKSIKITDHSSKYESIVIEDDGNTNLVVGQTSFNSISEINLNSLNLVIDENLTSSQKLYFDYSDVSFGSSLASYEKYFISGSPVLPSSPSDMQTGKTSLYKFDTDSNAFNAIKTFYSPFTQNGLAQEQQNDNSGFLLTELGNILSSSDYTINDDFGKSVDIGWGIAVIGSPNSNITGNQSPDNTGHVFIYEKNKGGTDNWGLINIFEGEPNSEFGNSISVYKDYIAIGSPGLKNNSGGVYLFKKTKRTKEHPWIKTSNIYESYEWNDILKKYQGTPTQDNSQYLNYLKNRSEIVSQKIKKHRDFLNVKLKIGEIDKDEFNSLLTTEEDYSQVYPFNYLYSSEDGCGDSYDESLWYKKRYWSSKVHPSVRCKDSKYENFYNKSVWPGYITNETDGSYIPNPHHYQNKNNKWAYRWKIQNVSGNNQPLSSLGDEDKTCNFGEFEMFTGDTINSFGDKSPLPMNDYSESPRSSIGDYTYDMIGLITPPNSGIKRFGEVVKLVDDKIYITNPSSEFPRCYSFKKTENEYGCEEWKLTHTISENEISGNSIKKPNLSDNMNSISLNYYDSYIELEICPNVSEYSEWVYKFDSQLVKTDTVSNNLSLNGGNRVAKCDSLCGTDNSYNFYSRFNYLNGYEVGQIPHNYGISTDISELFSDDNTTETNFKFFSKGKNENSFIKHSMQNEEHDKIGLSWKNFRENISFVYPNVKSGTHPSFMTIYSNEGKLDDGNYDPKYTLAEIGAQDTLNNQMVRLIFNSGQGDSETYIEFLYKGSIEGTHFTINELTLEMDLECTLPPNIGNSVSISDLNFFDPLSNQENARFFSKPEKGLSYKEPFTSDDTLAISWKNFRENVSFSYPAVSQGTQPSFMTIYFNEAKQPDGKYDPLYTIAEIGGTETLNNKKVRLNLNVGSKNETETYYEFSFKGSPEGTHFTLSELKVEFEYECTLPPNYGKSVPLENVIDDPYARFFSKPEKGLSYKEPFTSDDTLAISWKNFRENVSFSYPAVSQGTQPSFMTIYEDGSKLDNGNYDPKHILAEIGASNSLNGKKVKLTLNSGHFGGSETNYEFIYNGSVSGTHYTLSELKTKINETMAELPCNIGIARRVPFESKDKIYIGCKIPTFYSKGEKTLAYTHHTAADDELSISWKNLRENVSFMYPRIKSGANPSFMTIYSNDAKADDGTYNPLYILAEIGTTDSLNGKNVKLIFNQTECGSKQRFYYEFKFNGSIEGTHFTLNELNTQKVKDELIIASYSPEIQEESVNPISEKKSFKTTPVNNGIKKYIGDKIKDDFLNNKLESYFFTKKSDLNDDQDNFKEVSWVNFREGVTFTYPVLENSSEKSIMSIYSNEAYKNEEYNEIHKLAQIETTDAMNGQVVRLTLNDTDEKLRFYYEFIFEGSLEGTKYTLEQLETKISNDLNIPLSVYSPEKQNCKIRINKSDISAGFHKLYVALVDENNIPIGQQSSLDFYNNPTHFKTTPRHMVVDKSYKYSYDVRTEFGYSIDATKDYLLIGNPSDRSFSPINEQKKIFKGGSAFLFKCTNEKLLFLKKLYGTDEVEQDFNFRFGNSVSILNNNFIVSGYNEEMSDISLTDYGSEKRINIEDFIHGSEKFSETSYNTDEVIFQSYEYDLDAEIGDAVLRIKIEELDIDKSKVSDIQVKADFIDDGTHTLRINSPFGKYIDKIGGTYEKLENPIELGSGCEIPKSDTYEIYKNEHGWSVYFDTIRDRWVLSDKIGISTDLEEPKSWKSEIKSFELSNNIDKFDLITDDNLETLADIYSFKNTKLYKKWKFFTKNSDLYLKQHKVLDLILKLESRYSANLSLVNLDKLFNIYRNHSLRIIDERIYDKWKHNLDKIKSFIPIVTELETSDSLKINFKILKTILNLYINENEHDVLSSWFDEYGYIHLVRDVLDEVRPKYNDRLSLSNLNILFKLKKVTRGTDFKKWLNKLDTGFLVSDVYKSLSYSVDINFSISTESSPKNLPNSFNNGVGLLKEQNIEINSNNDTIGKNGFLTWGVYRGHTKIVGNYAYIYINKKPNIDFTDTIMFFYNSKKNARNGIGYYYEIKNDECNLIKTISTNKGKYEARKQFGASVSLSTDFIFVGSPVLGDFKIDELVTFGGNSVVSFGTTSKMFIEHNDIHPNYLKELKNSIAGSVISYDHHAIQSTKKYFLGNAFYKNGVLSLTDQTNHFSDILRNSGNLGFDIEFKSTQTLYENEILCRVESNEFNFSTNPTSLISGKITYDIDENGKFDINDLSLIFRYIMDFDIYESGDERVAEEIKYGLHTNNRIENSNKSPLVLTENEDLLLMNVLSSSANLNENFDKDYILSKLEKLYNDNEFDIDGDGITSTADARLLVRYFMGKTGKSLTHGVVDGFGSAKRFEPVDILNYLNEKTGKNIGKKIKEDFLKYKENDKADTMGSYLAPYATTIGLYSGLDLVMVAKLGKPVKILPNYPINFLIKYDS